METFVRHGIRIGLALCLSAIIHPLAADQPVPDAEVEAPAAEQVARPLLPRAWRPADFEVPNRRFTLEVARFPSGALASGIRIALENLGWGPIQQVSVGNDEVIYLGNFGSVAYATYAAQDLSIQKVASPKVVEFSEGLSFPTVGIDGPLLAPFTPSNGNDERLIAREEAGRQIGMLVENLPTRISDSGRASLESLAGKSDWSAAGDQIGTVAIELARLKTNAPLAFFLSQQIATRRWSAPDSTRIACAEIAADLQYGWLRDWRGAWSSSAALLEDPARDSAGRARDRLRMAALEIELASSGVEPRPLWNRVRLQLRRAWDLVPLDAEREQAKIELVYLQTFAWQGNWERVEELAKAHAVRYGTQFPHEAGLSKLLLSRSLERHENWDEAIAVLDRHFAGRALPPDDGLYIGFERLDLAARYRDVRSRLVRAQVGSEAIAIGERVDRVSRQNQD